MGLNQAGRFTILQRQIARSILKFTVLILFLIGLMTISIVLILPWQIVTATTPQKYQITLPLGISRTIWEAAIPSDNPMTAEKVALGEKLYFDKRLSADRTVSCATCHDPATALTDNNMVGVGIENKKGARNSPTVLNAMFFASQFWDGRAATLEEQAKGPIINPIEMGLKDHTMAVARIKEANDYAPLFAKVFSSEGITIDTIAKAIAAFERTQISGNSPFDRFNAGDKTAMSNAAQRGWKLFTGQARCNTCHVFDAKQPFFTDNKFHNIGVSAKDQTFDKLLSKTQSFLAQGKIYAQIPDEIALAPNYSELGRFLITKQSRDLGAFKTSGLRDIELTAPYFHNGSEKTLLDVIKFYDRGGYPNANLDSDIRSLHLGERQMNDLVEFLKALTSDDTRSKINSVKPQTRTPQS